MGMTSVDFNTENHTPNEVIE
ncbi:hypothetical protein 2050H1_105 [Serratia phage 2050H1]|uniref:Uncharacterized protein n=1 Tax=Serratia phage 2050H1 TaxID=2024250 RepID=A0A249Y2I6_9CAUD|nr:hypothetical protein 2050H1_105 [Serratia phage 2050H1]